VTRDLKEVLLRVIKTHREILVENTDILRSEFQNNQSEAFSLDHAGPRENTQMLVDLGVELVKTRSVRLVDKLDGLVDALAL